MFFEKVFGPILAPFRAIRNKWVGVKSIKGSLQADVSRAKGLGTNVQNMGKDAQKFAGQGQAAAAGAQQQVQGAQGYMQQGMPGAPGAPGAAPPMNPNPPIRTTGFWLWKKKFCSQCEKELDKTWDSCPHCAQAAALANAPKPAMKTQAIAIGGGGGGGGGGANPFSGMQMIGWLVPLQGPQRGELFTLGSSTVVGKDPSACTLVLQDSFMSSKHAEIKVEAGTWILKDMGSTNGTYVNDKRVDKQELVDNDFIKFGQFLCKFKSL
ncbi:MAG: FHA domain-containing protein [Myxococcales bacterium]|nr:FHA domain-containing protein [Myxococcales bacterium]